MVQTWSQRHNSRMFGILKQLTITYAAFAHSYHTPENRALKATHTPRNALSLLQRFMLPITEASVQHV